MSHIRILLIISSLVLLFQNCGGSGSATTDSSNQPQGSTSNSKLFTIYSPANLASIRYYHNIGLIAQKQPELIVYFNSGVPIVAQESVFDGSGNLQCTKALNVGSIDYTSIFNLSVAYTTNNSYISDCGSAHLDITLQDATEHIYQFNTNCYTQGQLLIQDPQYVVESAINSLLQTNATCP